MSDDDHTSGTEQALQDYVDLMLADPGSAGTAAPVPPARSNAEAKATTPTNAEAPPPVPKAKAARQPAKRRHGGVGYAASQSEQLQQRLIRERVKRLTPAPKPMVKPTEQPAPAKPAREKVKTAALVQATPAVAEKMLTRRVAPAPVTAVETVAKGTNVDTTEVKPVVKKTETEATPATAEKTGDKAALIDHWCANGRPAWAQDAFDCLFFKVAGLTLAVPLVELGSIYPLTGELTPIFGQVDWFMGLMPVGDKSIRTVNTAKVVMPERYQDHHAEGVRYVITIHGYDWGLAVDDVDKAIKLTPEEVRWRTERSKRPWLAGTVVEYMCALVDVKSLADMFDSNDRKRSRK